MARNKNTTQVAEVELDDEAIVELDDNDLEAEVTDEAPTEVTFSAKDLAKELGIDAKSFRRWLRSITPDRANKGGRWLFTAETKAALIDAYNKRHETGTEPTLPDAD